MSDKSRVRVRIAPSPTGIPHIGTTRTALYNFLFAKKNHGTFILRIEDTDRERFVQGAEEKLHEIFKWLGLTFDEKYKQSERLDIYKKYADQLLEKGMVYKDAGATRFKMPRSGITSWTDAVGDKLIQFENKDQEDFVIIKSDGYPTYNFANVIDDHLMEISHVIRGQEFISSTPKHIQLYNAFGFERPVFVHLPLVLGSDHQKLSKRHGAKSALDYRDEGYLPEAINNYMALLGWNSGGDKEIMEMDEMIKLFDLNDIHTASPIFDPSKLEWMNGVYIRKSQISNLKSQILQLIPEFKKIENVVLEKLIGLSQSRMKTLQEFKLLATPFFSAPPNIPLSSEERKMASELLDFLNAIEEWNAENILLAMKKFFDKQGQRMPVIYKLFFEEKHGLPLPDMFEILGKEKTLKKLQKRLN